MLQPEVRLKTALPFTATYQHTQMTHCWAHPNLSAGRITVILSHAMAELMYLEAAMYNLYSLKLSNRHAHRHTPGYQTELLTCNYF